MGLTFAEIAVRFEAEAPLTILWVVCCDMGPRLPACRVCGGGLSGRQRNPLAAAARDAQPALELELEGEGRVGEVLGMRLD